MKQKKFLRICLFVFVLCFTILFSKEPPKWFQNPNPHLPVSIQVNALLRTKCSKNIILYIGDGMGLSQITGAITANRGKLNLEYFPYIGLSKTHSIDRYITDSAASATAIATGIKTYNNGIGVNPDSQNVKTILELAEEKGLATGIVVTSSVTHATPAAFISHQANRTLEEQIALDYLRVPIDIFIGGGMRYFSKRSDHLDLIQELKNRGYTVLTSLKDADTITRGPLAIFTAEEHDLPALERGNRLSQGVGLALRLLSQNPNGFFLMVEGSQIDWGGHDNDTERIIQEMLDFDQAIGEGLLFAERNGETLIIVTADHETGGMAIENGSISEGKVLADFTTKEHTGIMVPVFAIGPQAEQFTGIYENASLFEKMRKALGL